jgi:hypothetical protein
MKTKVRESEVVINIVLTPEELKEVALLFRLTKHSKREIPDMYLSFSEYSDNGVPYLSISFYKKKSEKCFSSTSNKV